MFKGAAAEHRAAAYYIDQGAAVYWPAVPVETDLIVEREDGVIDKIQVKYASWTKTKGHSATYEKLNVRTYGWSGGRTKTHDGPEYDFLFVISEDGRMWEIPACTLPPHAIGLDVRGGKTQRKPTKRWDKYRVAHLHN
ncbi:hypothetical protein J2R95_003153 [Bradyrhizobium japonicum]|nr:hypothetical protein [Bradyrhizobium japonicum]